MHTTNGRQCEEVEIAVKNLNELIGGGAITLPIQASTSGVFQGTGASAGFTPDGGMNPGNWGRDRGDASVLNSVIWRSVT